MFIKLVKRFSTILKNIFVLLLSVIVGKNDKCVLLGAWMGEKFADNPRFLFQYLSENKTSLNIEHVVWATRSEAVMNNLKCMGYESVLIGSLSSFYWHCKCGIHLICDMQYDNSEYLGDIDSSLSAGAKKIQLWHGNGIKCVPGAKISYKFPLNWFIKLSTPGFWYTENYKFLCKCDLDYVFFEKKFAVDKKQCIDSAYPRTCQCLRYYASESNVLERMKKYNKVILFLPTFRKNYESYIHPLVNSEIVDYLQDNNILWIEKPHAADKGGLTTNAINNANVLLLDSCFDINVLMPHIDLLITDYSSAMLDAMFFRKQVVYYVPDYQYYINNDRGFLMDFDSVCITPKVESIDALPRAIDLTLKIEEYDVNAEMIRSLFWKHEDWSYKEIWNSIVSAL